MNVDRRILNGGLITAIVLGALVLTLPVTLPSSLRRHLSAAVGERFGGTVEMDALRVSIFPRLRVSGDTVIVRFKGRTDVPPLVTVKSFSAEASLFHLLGSRLRLKRVQLEGLEVNVPPGGMKMKGEKASAPASEDPAADHGTGKSPIVIDELLASPAMVRILRREPGKAPREFAIERLVMRDTGAETPWPFTATLTNPTPPGRIDVNGTFGPWNADSPSQTALGAKYVFSQADLGVFHGIQGTLHSDGQFSGVLERIDVNGTTDVPDFALSDVGQTVHLQARFHSIVDGTNGNTWLQPVDATLGGSSVHATGGVTEVEGRHGRVVTLEVVMDPARIEDVLKLAVKTRDGNAPMTGALKLKTTFVLPPGPASAMDKLRLNGSFRLDDARFGSRGLQSKLNEFSRKAQGDGGQVEEVASDFSGQFVMSNGTINLSKVTFTMPGARVDLAGTYAMRTKVMDFKGTVRLDAKLSQLTVGAKSVFLKLVEPLFRRKNVTVIPITIGGTVDEPKVGLDAVRAFTPK